MSDPLSPYTKEEDDVIRAMRADGMEFPVIARALRGRSVGSVTRRYTRINSGQPRYCYLRNSAEAKGESIPGINTRAREDAVLGSRALLRALVAYARKHKPATPLARLAA